jgi:hypothetical protein
VHSSASWGLAQAVSDALGSCTLAWRIGVSLGLTAGIVQVVFALWRPPSQAVAVIR